MSPTGNFAELAQKGFPSPYILEKRIGVISEYEDFVTGFVIDGARVLRLAPPASPSPLCFCRGPSPVEPEPRLHPTPLALSGFEKPIEVQDFR
jgi:hypothetical protein